jgi:hypothetical protein
MLNLFDNDLHLHVNVINVCSRHQPVSAWRQGKHAGLIRAAQPLRHPDQSGSYVLLQKNLPRWPIPP